ncbi:MAG: alkaline phosphatase family protein [Promethearchaeota archaeon]
MFVLGLDGGSWSIIDPLIQKDLLPNLKALLQSGIHTTLESTIPPLTYPAWKAYSMGKNPGAIGQAFGLVYPSFTQQKILTSNSTCFIGDEIWDILGKHQLKSAVINFPTGEPPKEIHGIFVAGPLADKNDFARPLQFQADLKQQGWVLLPEGYITQDPKTLNSFLEVIKSRFDLAINMIKSNEYHFIHCTIYLTDSVQHFDFDGEYTTEVMRFIDQQLGRVMKYLQNDWYFFLMSDHGFKQPQAVFYLYPFLEERGYVRTKWVLDWGTFFVISGKIGLTFDRLIRLLKKLRLLGLLRKFISPKTQHKIARKVPGKGRGRKLEGMESKLDWKKSLVIPIFSTLYINQGNPDAIHRRKMILHELKKELMALINPETGKNLFTNVFFREEVYSGPFLEHAPELILVPSQEIAISDVYTKGDYLKINAEIWKGVHDRFGILSISGPEISKGGTINPVQIYDLAPTILFLLGVPIPSDMQGKVLREMFEPKSEINSRKEEIVIASEHNLSFTKDSKQDKDSEARVKQRLSDLGYL